MSAMIDGVPRSAFAHHLVVLPHHVDEQGHASSVAILDWLMDAAIAHSAALGWDHDAYTRLGGTFVVRRHEIEYMRAAYEGEAVTVWTWPSAIETASAERCYVAVRDNAGAIARARTRWAFVRIVDLRPLRIPDDLRTTFDPARFAAGDGAPAGV